MGKPYSLAFALKSNLAQGQIVQAWNNSSKLPPEQADDNKTSQVFVSLSIQGLCLYIEERESERFPHTACLCPRMSEMLQTILARHVQRKLPLISVVHCYDRACQGYISKTCRTCSTLHRAARRSLDIQSGAISTFRMLVGRTIRVARL